MAADSLEALGLELRAEAVAWLASLAPTALPDGTLAARELFQALGELEAEVADAAANEVELTRLQAWLTSGFFAEPEPFAPADAVVAEVMDEARGRETADAAPAGAAGWTADSGLSATQAQSAGTTFFEPTNVLPSASGANEFAAGNSQSPPSRTASADLPSPDLGLPQAPAPAREKQPPATPPSPTGKLFDTDSSAQAENERHVSPLREERAGRGPGTESPPADTRREPPVRGIQGLAALAALAGRGGIEVPAPVEDADRAPDRPRGASDRAAMDAEARTPRAASLDAHRTDAVHPPLRRTPEERGPSSAARSMDAGGAREVERREEDAVPPPPRIIRIPFTAPVMEDADAGWATGAPLPIPFLTAPGEAEEDARRGGSSTEPPVSDARQPVAMPSMRVFDGAEPAREVRPAAETEWTAFAGPRESAETFLARAARIAGHRPRPAVEVVGSAAPAVEAAAVVQPIIAAAPAVQPVAPPEPERTVLERDVAEAAEWAAPDVTDLLDALASEIAHEYRRYYGE